MVIESSRRSDRLCARAVTRVSSVAAIALALTACEPDKAKTGPELSFTVAALNLPGVDYACYDLAVTGPTGPVWHAGTPGLAYNQGDDDTLCSWQYGNGAGGDIAYVGPCDADDGDGDSPAQATNTITLWFDGLYVDPDSDHDAEEDDDIGEWQNPCPDGCSVTATCRENADTAVKLDFTVLRAAHQGFFDVAVNFSDVFCSAKLDCQDALLHDPESDQRGPTAVVAFACTAGPAAPGSTTPDPTHLYLDDYRIDCPAHGTTAATSYIVQPSLGPGNIGGQEPGIFQVATYRGSEQLANVDKCFWNTAIGLDIEDLIDVGQLGPGCTLHGRGTASDHALAGGHTPTNTVYPLIEWDVQLTDDEGGLACSSHPLNGTPAGVATHYTDFAGAKLGCSMECATGKVTCPGRVLCDATPLGLDRPVKLSQTTAAGNPSLTLSFEGTDYPFPLPQGAVVSGCCADSCCTAGVK